MLNKDLSEEEVKKYKRQSLAKWKKVQRAVEYLSLVFDGECGYCLLQDDDEQLDERKMCRGCALYIKKICHNNGGLASSAKLPYWKTSRAIDTIEAYTEVIVKAIEDDIDK